MGNPGIDKKCSARAPQAQRPAGTRRSPREGAGKREATPLGGAPSRPGRPPGPHLLRPEQVVAVLAEQAVGLLHALALVHVAGEEDALHVGLQLPRPAAGAASAPRRARLACTYRALALRFPPPACGDCRTGLAMLRFPAGRAGDVRVARRPVPSPPPGFRPCRAGS